ncbi:UTP--glucose-1-phosphate uridylyltransferase [Boudabousia tangfeifanii]|uniref:UTP--glucose-1-phosphate uridylyltransferase n=1 Tax=Boudabousia tangfeifanii TaxID=1912795 RepID=A0A1D9MJ27_9ACTO|nr:UTP--glucose-1-phosphate uridylyltransferase [Boudabousia tangfeifanii]AOZ72286.1 UTP--glucose-1-phosphate uridylyltransferase [Boudabousia tangfeifanii]
MEKQTAAIKHAVIPAAGRGTRFLPITKSVPKEALPLVDTPAIEYVVTEAARAGLDDVLLISSGSKRALEDYFDHDLELEATLAKDGKDELLAFARRGAQIAQVHSVRQGDPKGLGHAVLQAKAHVGPNPFAVLLPDDIMHPDSSLLEQMVAVRQEFGGSVIALMEVPADQVQAYGNAAVKELPADQLPEGVKAFEVTDLVEKPAPGTELSNYAVIGRYLLAPEVFAQLEQVQPGAGGEIQLTDALLGLLQDPASGGVRAVLCQDRRFDTGDKFGYLTANIELALEDEKLGPRLREWLAAKEW